MLNRPTSMLSDTAPTAGMLGDEHDPQGRLMQLWFFVLVPLLIILGRVAYLQLMLREDFATGFSLTTETLEEIPARDGRILAADGSVLADDVQRFDVAIYYPAIQDPADEKWISAKAKPRLSKADRKDRDKVDAEKRRVKEENEALWTRLATLTNRPLVELQQSRSKEQVRIERIKDSVVRNHQARQATESQKPEASGLSWDAIWQRLQDKLTEPVELSNGPRLIAEELEYHAIIPDVSTDVKEEIEAHPKRYPYCKIITRTRRTYPRGELASHLIGTRKPMTDERRQARRVAYPDGDPLDYRVGDPCGTSGLEKNYDAYIKGVRGQRALTRNRRGEIVDSRVVREPRHGHDLVLTLDPEIQLRSEQLLDAALKVTQGGAIDLESNRGATREVTCPQGGCLVAIDVHSGAIIAAAAAPRFDLNLLVAPDASRWDETISDPRSPFLSRATQMALPPGSVFKVISAIASVESGKMPPEDRFYCRGYLDRPDQHRCLPFRHQGVGHSDVTLEEALCRSCNVYFFTAARRMGPQTLVDWARQFGIGQPTGIDLPFEATGQLPSPDALPKTGEKRMSWKPSETLGLAIGQSSLTVTPLQIARVMAAIANDGYLVTPHLAASSGPSLLSESESIRRSLPQGEARPILNLHRDTLDHVRAGLTMVVNDSHGTAHKTVRLKEVTIAGKTGTAQTNGVDHAWFAGYVPAERPRIAFAVVLEHGGGGGKAAGPVAREFVKTLVDLGIVTKSTELAAQEPRHAPRATD